METLLFSGLHKRDFCHPRPPCVKVVPSTLIYSHPCRTNTDKKIRQTPIDTSCFQIYNLYNSQSKVESGDGYGVSLLDYRFNCNLGRVFKGILQQSAH
jgi:hypothetical protein